MKSTPPYVVTVRPTIYGPRCARQLARPSTHHAIYSPAPVRFFAERGEAEEAARVTETTSRYPCQARAERVDRLPAYLVAQL